MPLEAINYIHIIIFVYGNLHFNAPYSSIIIYICR